MALYVRTSDRCDSKTNCVASVVRACIEGANLLCVLVLKGANLLCLLVLKGANIEGGKSVVRACIEGGKY